MKHLIATACIFSLGSITALTLQACSAPDDESATATTTSALQAQSQAGLTDGIVDTEGTLAPEPAVAAKAVADHPIKNLFPEGCATKTLEGNVVTLSLAKCTGPFGQVELEGSLVATFSKSKEDVLHLDIVAKEGMKASGRPLTYGAQADVRFEGSQRLLTYHGSSNGTTKRGRVFSRTTDLTIAADRATECAQIDGVSKGSVGAYDIDLTIEGLKGCRHACPTGGVARARASGPLLKETTIEVRFDGSDSAHVKVEGRKSRELDIGLDCDAGEAVE